MRQEFTEQERLKSKVERLDKQAYLVKERRVIRKRFYIIYSLRLPWLVIRFLIFKVLFKLKKHRQVRQYLKNYFKTYFYWQGLSDYQVFPLKQHFSKPTLIFAVRSTELLTPFLLTQFGNHVSLPVDNELERFPLNFFTPYLKFGKMMSVMGHADQELPKSLDDIKVNLEKNIPTIVYINPGFASPTTTETLTLFNEVLSLLELDIACYFLKVKEFETYHVSSLASPILPSLHMVSKEELFRYNITTSDKEKLENIAFFFEFRNIMLL